MNKNYYTHKHELTGKNYENNASFAVVDN